MRGYAAFEAFGGEVADALVRVPQEAAQQAGVVNAVAVLVQEEVHPPFLGLQPLVQSLERVVHAVAIGVAELLDLVPALFKDAAKAIAQQPVRAVLCAGDVVDAIAIEIDDIVDEAVVVCVAEATVEIVYAVSVLVAESVVYAVFIGV